MSVEKSEKATSSHFFQGGWKTSEQVKTTRITAMPLTKNHIFKISCTELVDSQITNYKFYVDGSETEGVLTEGGSLFIEGKDIHIRQISDGTNILATWECVQETGKDFYSSNWSAYPDKADEILLASFSGEKDFIVEIFKSNANCRDGKMTLIVDGTTIKDVDNKVLQLLEGSSILGHGRLVKIKVSGYCSANQHFSGRIKILKELYS